MAFMLEDRIGNARRSARRVAMASVRETKRCMPQLMSSLSAATSLRCADDYSCVDIRNCSVPESADSAVLVRGTSPDPVLEEPRQGRLYRWIALLVAARDCIPHRRAEGVLSRCMASVVGAGKRHGPDCIRSMAFLEGTPRFGIREAGGKDGTQRQGRNRAVRDLRPHSASAICRIVPRDSRGMPAGRDEICVAGCGRLDTSHASRDFPGGKRDAFEVWDSV